MNQDDEVSRNSRFQKVGLILAVLFFVLSVVMVIRNHGGAAAVFSADTREITFAHWQLEDGFREGFDEAIKIYEAEKAKQGVKVRVRQVAVPVRGYPQWFLTQLIGGQPADVIELTGSSDIRNQYFHALSPYIGEKNPWNKGTPLEEYSWRESFSDDMLAALDQAYSEFFSVSLFTMTTRVYVNFDLYRKATGTDRLPETVTEWIDACKKLQEYGVRHHRPVIPIGVRGFDKGTIGTLLNDYHSQMNSDFSETCSQFGFGVAAADVMRLVNEGKLERDRLLRPVELVAEIGQYFAEGFPSIDLEQTKYLFFSGNVAFFIDGSWNAWSMVNNSPFTVRIMRIPELTADHRLGKKSFGRVNELGTGIGGQFGIPKKSKHFDLALDFLRFITSYRINRMTMVEHCRWLSSLKKMEYDGLMKTIEPLSNTSYTSVSNPFSSGTYATRRTLQRLENVIINNPADVKQAFWDGMLDDRRFIIEEQQEAIYGIQRTLWSMDGSRSALTLGAADPALTDQERDLFRMRADIALEGMVSRFKNQDNAVILIDELKKLKREDR